MQHLIRFRKKATIDIQPANSSRLEQVQVQPGLTVEGEVRCHVDLDRLLEVADIYLADGGGIMRGVPCYTFSFVDHPQE